jgi:hypothetical protein
MYYRNITGTLPVIKLTPNTGNKCYIGDNDN